MKTKVITLMLGVVFAVGNIGTIPVYAAEAPVHEEEVADETDTEESVEEQVDALLQPADGETTVESVEDAESGQEISNGTTDEALDEISNGTTDEALDEISNEASEEVQEADQNEKKDSVLSEQTDEITANDLIEETSDFEDEGDTEIQDGWNGDYGYWQYYVDGEPLKNQIKRIGSALYGFNNEGYMYADCIFKLEDENGTELTYRARGNGALYENEWCQIYDGPGDPYWFYFGEGGVGANGMLKLKGVLYAFTDGQMLKNTTYNDETGTYRIGSNGVATRIEWVEGWNSIGGKWYYYEDGRFCVNEIKKIGSNYYGFNEKGQMNRNGLFNTYGENMNVLVDHYYAKSNGQLLVNGWYQDNMGQWFYFGADGKGLNGLHTVGGKLYAFSDGYMITNYMYHDESGVYQIGGNGIAKKVSLNGWYEYDNRWYFFENGKLVTNEVRKIGGKYYLFDSEGAMLKSRIGYIYDEESIETGRYERVSGPYYAKADGSLYVNEWVPEYNGLPKYGNILWWYYFGDGGLGADGLKTINGKLYAFSKGIMLIGGYNDMTGIYIIDENGVATKAETSLENHQASYGEQSWCFDNGEYYFFSDGELLKNEIRMFYDGNMDGFHAFDETGRMYHDEEFELFDERTGKNYHYRAGYLGRLYSKEWFQAENGDKYYYEAGGKGADGLAYVDGKIYLFENGKMLNSLVDQIVSIKGSLYMIDSSGNAYKVKNGWNSIAGYKYYFENDAKCTGLKQIDGSTYYFRESGAMRTGWQKVDGNWHYFSGGGAMVTGWQKIGNIWYYFDRTGAMATGLQTIGNTKYFFSGSGAMVTGWQKVDGNWYYFSGGGAMVTGWQKISNVWYYFDGTGVMATGLQTIGNTKYFFSGGGAMVTGWQKVDGIWYYFSGGGAMATGWQKISNVWYYLDGTGVMATGLQTIGNAKYYFSGSGAMVTGWQKIENEWYYFSGGGAMVRNSWVGDYYLTDSGAMATNTWIGSYYVGSDGKWIRGYRAAN